MTQEKEKRLKELKNKFELVHKGTGEVIGHSYPGGAPITDEDSYKWTGTEAEWSEYKPLYWEDLNERAESGTNDFKKRLAEIFYGGKQLNK